MTERFDAAGIIADKTTILKSAMMPIKLVCRREEAKRARSEDDDEEEPSRCHTVLLKSSNDLRRDQLIIACIDLMDMLLKREGVDLNIITYRVTATSHNQVRRMRTWDKV